MPLAVRAADGAELSLQKAGCTTCEGRHHGTGERSGMCEGPPTIRIEPGGRYELTWSAQNFLERLAA